MPSAANHQGNFTLSGEWSPCIILIGMLLRTAAADHTCTKIKLKLTLTLNQTCLYWVSIITREFAVTKHSQHMNTAFCISWLADYRH